MKIVDSDAFMDMPQSSQLLYFQLSMRADDDGFVGNPKKIMRMVGSSEDDYKILVAKRFILVFPNGVCVIKHWLIHNYIAKDRYTETAYLPEKTLISIKENGAYTECIQDVDKTYTKVRLELGKVSKIESVSVKKFVKPTLEQLTEYCLERKNSVSPQKFIDHYESNGWKIGGKGAMKDWKAAVRTWESNSFGNGKGGSKPVNVLSTQHSKTLSEKMKEGALRNS